VDRRDARRVERAGSALSNGLSEQAPVGANGNDSCGAVADGAPATRDEGVRFLARLSRAARPRMARRLLAAADADRQRIEQDLHDGVQQQLTGLRIRLALAAERFHDRGDTEVSAALEGFGDDVENAINDLRDLAHGIYPALLSSYGLSAALTAAAGRAAPGATVHGHVRRCRQEVETAVYFSCLAALDNAAKHAGARQVSIRLTDTGDALHFTVSDSGAGFDPSRTPAGSGIAHMRDRLTAIGGTLTVDSAPAQGTRVSGHVPDPWLDPVAPAERQTAGVPPRAPPSPDLGPGAHIRRRQDHG
jgi:signal transduction histidine kinase